MKKRFAVFSAMLMALCASGVLASRIVAQAPQEDDLSSPKLRISWPEFKKQYDEKKIVVVDVRGDQTYATGHIPGARSIPLDQIESHAMELKKLKKPIVVYCA